MSATNLLVKVPSIVSNISYPRICSKYSVCNFYHFRGRHFAESVDSKNLNYMAHQDELSLEEQKLNAEKLRNKSRLSVEHRNILFNKKPYLEPMAKHHLTVKYNRKMYGVYGSASNVNPGIMWPTKKDIMERNEYENVAYPFSIQQMVSAAEEEIKMKELKMQQQHEQVIEKLAKLNTWKQELKDKIVKKEAEALVAKEKKDRLIEEVRRHFGYKVDARDERFQELLATKQKEQRKREKEARMAQKEKIAIARMMEKHKESEESP